MAESNSNSDRRGALSRRFRRLLATVRAGVRGQRGLQEAADRSEQKAERSEQKYADLLANNPQAVFVFDVDTLAFLEANDAASNLYGYTRDEFRSRTVPDILGPNKAPFLESIKHDPNLQRSGPRKHRSKEGAALDVELTSIRLTYDGHDARLVVVEDCTQRNKLERLLEQSQRLETVGQLAGGIAHDFNNLLAVIITYADFVADELPDSDVKRDVGEIQRAASRAADLTRQLLTFARQEVASPQLLDLNSTVADVENLLRRTIGEDIELSLSLADALPSVRADPGQMEQVFLNLTLNARDAMTRGGRLVVETSNVEVDDAYSASHPGVEPGRYVRLSVSDTGTGMTPEVAARAFEPFFTTKPAGEGTGLGLATVYGIVKRAGGNIDIYSEPSRGTRVTIQLPAIDEPASEARRQVSEPQITAGGGRTVLVVEDEGPVLMAAIRILGKHGYEVIGHSDPMDALKVLADVAKVIDVLLTDVVMPRTSGVELANEARVLRPGLPIVYMSGYSRELVTDRGALPAGTRVVQKPFTRRDLLEAIADSLAAPSAG